MLTPMQQDALTEMLNIQLGASASLLSDMVNQKIILSVPELLLQKTYQIDCGILAKYDISKSEDAVSTTLIFGGEFNGKATIILPKDKAAVLVSACLGEEINIWDNELSGEAADVIKEICNVILNSLIGEFGNILDVKLDYISLDTEFSLEPLRGSTAVPQIMLLFTSFFLMESQIRGIILIALSSTSFQMLIDKIDDMLR